jgi:hypothetical protein
MKKTLKVFYLKAHWKYISRCMPTKYTSLFSRKLILRFNYSFLDKLVMKLSIDEGHQTLDILSKKFLFP